MSKTTTFFAQLMATRKFLKARSVQSRLKTRSDVERWQQKQLREFLKNIAPRAPAFEELKHKPLTDYPIMEKDVLMANFEQYNRLGITAEEGWSAYGSGSHPQGYFVGASTGTSGNRGLYVISNKERYLWLGTILAKALPRFYRTRHRIAVILPANSSLYDTANESGRLKLQYFGLEKGIDPILLEVGQFEPTVIVAPPKVLRALSEANLDLNPTTIFSSAEVLDPLDREAIEERFSLTVREIYMATEGLFGVACPLGKLHLAEDAVLFEWENDPSGGPLKTPIITDFSRQTQIMVRYRMNDLLHLSEYPCRCGSPLQAVDRIVGRMDDVFTLPLHKQPEQYVRITPDIIRNTILESHPGIKDFRVIQTASNAVRVALAPGFEDAANLARQALSNLFAGAGASPQIEAITHPLKVYGDVKLRRVMRTRDINI